MFIDFLTLLLANMTAGLAVFGWFLLRGLASEDNKAWAPAFAVPGLIALVFGGIITATWPLPGQFNIMYGEMSVLFGAVFLGAAWALARGWSLSPLSIVTLVAGLYAILIGQQILSEQLLPMKNTISGMAFILTGAGGVLLGVVLCLKKAPLIRWAAAAVVLAAAFIWGAATCNAYRGHLRMFAGYLPHPTLKKDHNEAATKPAPRATTAPAAPAE